MKFTWPKGAIQWKGVLKQYRAALLVLLAGVLLLLLPGSGGRTREESGSAAVQEEAFDLDAFEAKLAQAVSQIQGAGEARVYLTLRSSARQVLAQDQDLTQSGSSTSTLTLNKGSGVQEVVSLQTVAPQFQGAVVICPGGADPQVQLRVLGAVSALTGLGSDRISICKSAS